MFEKKAKENFEFKVFPCTFNHSYSIIFLIFIHVIVDMFKSPS